MPDVIICAENIGKRYVLNHQTGGAGYTRFSESLAYWAKAPLRAFQRSVRPLQPSSLSPHPSQEDFWALKDVSFEIKRGEVVGIIGRNGAGKSTLLKILSRITEPTTGRITLKGRVASLLEVGTGFHPELTGRENIYLNGAILGMRREEIKAKFDEIVAFAEIEKFLDTPVKRYSSGMYVRLAFAVAAHLEPEILIVDEVLAVGDAKFQQKCLGKMQDVAKNGQKTVLFVSHNMAAITALTTRSILMQQGQVSVDGRSAEVIQTFLASMSQASDKGRHWGKGPHTKITGVEICDDRNTKVGSYTPGKTWSVVVEFDTDGTPGMSMEIFLVDANQQRVGIFSLYQFHQTELPRESGCYRFSVCLDPLWLAAGSYSLDVTTSIPNVSWDHYVGQAAEFDVAFCNPMGLTWDFRASDGFGTIALVCPTAPEFQRI